MLLKTIMYRNELKYKKTFLFIAAAISFPLLLNAQVCTPDYFFHRYQGNGAAVYTGKVITTYQHEVIAAGSTLKLNGEFLDATDGWVIKLSPRGTVLWSKRYFIPGFNSGGFLSIENATDSTYLVTARYGKYKRRIDGSLQELDAASFLIYLDKFGNIIWVKRITNYINDSFLFGITRLQDNSFLIAGNIQNSAGQKILLLKVNLSGAVDWYRIILTEGIQTGIPVVKQLNNGQLLLTGYTMRFAPDFTYSTDQGYYFFKFEANSGSLLRSSAIYFNRQHLTRPASFDNINSVIELPNDTLILASSFSGQQLFGPLPGTRQALIIKAGTNGQFYSASGYMNTQPGLRLSDAKLIDGKFGLLLDNGYKSFYAEVDRSGEITSQRAYGNAYSLLEGYKLIEGAPQIRTFFYGRGQYPIIGLMKAESGGFIPCIETPSQLIREDVSSQFSTGTIDQSNIISSFPFKFEDMGNSVAWSYYNFNTTTDCRVTCCDNIRSDTTRTELCSTYGYRLPDNSIVKETGIYYVNVKNANNCDSIAYFDVKFSFKPAVNLGNDTCLINNQPVTLVADSGFANYNWSGLNSPDHKYTVTSPGSYTLSITNQCGTGNDEIIVYEDCEHPVYIPSAFTPNNDGRNDVFRYPAQNKNRFISLSIYNRWGQRIFYSTNPREDWDGQYKNQQQPGDVYAYVLQLKTLDGRPITKKGTVVLIR